MIWYIAAESCVLSLFGWMVYRNWGWWSHPIIGFWDALLFPLFLGAIAFVAVSVGSLGIAYLIAQHLGSKQPWVWERVYTGKMVSMRSSDGIKGQFGGGLFMIHGQVGSKVVYTYYTTDESGGYFPHTWTADSDTSIFEEDRQDGELRTFDLAFKNPSVEWFAELPSRQAERRAAEFHIPKGSLKQAFEIQ